MLNFKSFGRIHLIILSVFLGILFAIGTGTALSYIYKKTPTVENHLVPGIVACEVEFVLDGNAKKDVSVKNTGNTSEYIRAYIIVNWQSDTDTYEILSRPPKQSVDYEIVFGDALWKEGTDGFWYYTESIEPEENTATFIESITPIGTAPEGYSLSVEIIASAIQANPESVVADEWGVGVNSGQLEP